MQPFTSSLSDEQWEKVASFSRYQEAERAVDHLADQKFPVEHTSIVAVGLRYIERVTGRLNWFRAAIYNAASGFMVGVFIGFLLGLLNVVRPLVSSLLLGFYGGMIGLVIGGLFGLISYAFSGGKRDFMTLPGMDAASYDIMVQAAYAQRARGLLLAHFGNASLSSGNQQLDDQKSAS